MYIFMDITNVCGLKQNLQLIESFGVFLYIHYVSTICILANLCGFKQNLQLIEIFGVFFYVYYALCDHILYVKLDCVQFN